MITQNRHTGNYEVTCDSCSVKHIEIETDDFREVVRLLKNIGWSIYMDHETDEWMHTCVDCGLK